MTSRRRAEVRAVAEASQPAEVRGLASRAKWPERAGRTRVAGSRLSGSGASFRARTRDHRVTGRRDQEVRGCGLTARL
jgi:hypothetical protein